MKATSSRLIRSTRLPLMALSALALLCASLVANAQILVQYNFAATFPGGLSPSTVVGNMTATAVGNAGFSAVRSTAGGGSYAVTTSQLPGSFSTAEYFFFTLNASTGYFLNLGNLTFQAANAASSGVLPNGQWDVRTSIDSYATSLGLFSSNTTSSVFETKTVDLSAPAYQGLTTITFRIFIWDALSTNSNTKSLRTDNLTVNGAVVVPEASAVMLMFLGISVLLMRRRYAYHKINPAANSH